MQVEALARRMPDLQRSAFRDGKAAQYTAGHVMGALYVQRAVRPETRQTLFSLGFFTFTFGFPFLNAGIRCARRMKKD